MKTFRATRGRHGVGANYGVILVGEDERDSIREFYKRKCEGATVLSITEPGEKGHFHVEHSGRAEYVHRGIRGQGIETVYDDSFFDFREVA
jgi:hypothetical protein